MSHTCPCNKIVAEFHLPPIDIYNDRLLIQFSVKSLSKPMTFAATFVYYIKKLTSLFYTLHVYTLYWPVECDRNYYSILIYLQQEKESIIKFHLLCVRWVVDGHQLKPHTRHQCQLPLLVAQFIVLLPPVTTTVVLKECGNFITLSVHIYIQYNTNADKSYCHTIYHLSIWSW